VKNKINLVLGLFVLIASVVPASAQLFRLPPLPIWHPHPAPAPVIGVGLLAVAATAGAVAFSRKFFRKR
jgi:hypothetical protein